MSPSVQPSSPSVQPSQSPQTSTSPELSVPAPEHPLLAMFVEDNSLTAFQRLSMQRMGIGTTGPASTVGDGECLFRSMSQQRAARSIDKGTVWAMSNPQQAQIDFAAQQVQAAETLQHDSDIRARVVANAAQILNPAAPNRALLRKALRRQSVSCLPDFMAAKLR